MPKNIEDIIVPDRKKSIRDIPIPDGRKKQTTSPTVSESTTFNNKGGEGDFLSRLDGATDFPRKRVFQNAFSGVKSGGKRVFSKKIWISGVILALVLIFAVLSFFSGGTLTYVPKSLALTFDKSTLTAYKTGDKGLLYSVVKLSLDKGVNVPAKGEEQVSRKASGTIVVYNDATTASQRLMEKTRFEASNGKIYRITSAVNIPGKKTVNGESQPGSVEVVVYADEAGAAYNQDLTDFTLPGLKGTDRYKTIYARSKTSMSGGYVGKARIVSEEDQKKAEADLRTALEGEVMQSAREQVPADFVLFQPLSFVTFETLPQVDAGDGGVTISVKGNLHGVMFKRSDLSHYLASDKTTLSDSDEVSIENMDSLTFAFSGTPPTDLLRSNQISFEVSGDGNLVWKTDESALKSSLAGKKRSDVASIINNFPSIKEADVVIRPFWKNSFPDKASEVLIKRATTE